MSVHTNGVSIFSGGSRGGAGGPAPPLFLDQIEARRAEKTFFETGLPPPPRPPYLKVWIVKQSDHENYGHDHTR